MLPKPDNLLGPGKLHDKKKITNSFKVSSDLHMALWHIDTLQPTNLYKQK